MLFNPLLDYFPIIPNVKGDFSSGLVNVTKKEQQVQNSLQTTDSRDMSTNTNLTTSTISSYNITTAPTITISSPNSTVGGATTTPATTQTATPTIATKKEATTSPSTALKGSLTDGLSMGKLVIYGAIGGALYLLYKNRKKLTKGALNLTPQGRVINAVKETKEKIKKVTAPKPKPTKPKITAVKKKSNHTKKPAVKKKVSKK